MQSLDTLGKLADVKGNVRATLDKLKGIKADLVCGNEGWQEWGFEELLDELNKWGDINPIDENGESKQFQNKPAMNTRSKLYHARDSPRESRELACVYCEDSTHKSFDRPKVSKRDGRKRILAEQKRCFTCIGTQHRASDCKSKLGCQICHKRHHTSICDQAQHGNSNVKVTHPIVIVQVEGVKCRTLLDTGAQELGVHTLLQLYLIEFQRDGVRKRSGEST